MSRSSQRMPPDPQAPLAQRAAEVLGDAEGAAYRAQLGERAAGVEALEAALGRRRARRRMAHAAWAAIGVGAAAAVLVLVLHSDRGEIAPGSTPAPQAMAPVPGLVGATVSQVTGGAQIIRPSGTVAATAGSPLARGDGLEAGGAGPAQVIFSTGTHLTLEPHTRLTLAEVSTVQRLVLSSGALHLDVAKLRPGQRFIVATKDAEIEVRGTSFDVSVVPADGACGEGTTTRVGVREGIVSVRITGHEVELRAGDRWPEGCAPDAVPAVAERRRPRRVTALRTTPPPPADRSTLAEQNELFARALAARRRAQPAEALRLLEELATRYPNGPLSEAVRDERQRILRGRAAPREP